jgi:hypothetical protein
MCLRWATIHSLHHPKSILGLCRTGGRMQVTRIPTTDPTEMDGPV